MMQTSITPLALQNDAGNERAPSNKRMSVERIYQKKTQLEHILLRPDTYIGSVEPLTQAMWVYDGETEGMVHREITFVPGLYKIFDEILVNAADNKQRDQKMDCIKIDIDPENNVIIIYNNGKGIPIVEHKVEKMYVPSLIFGHLLTSSNYNDDEKKVTGGRNGYGAKLCNIFSTKFTVETSCRESKTSFKQCWSENMNKCTDPKIKAASGEDFTRITFSPDLPKFKMTTLDKDTVALLSRRAFDIAGTTKGVRVFLNGKRLPIKNFKEYVEQYLKGKEDEQGNPLKVVYEVVNPRWEVAMTMSDRGFQQISFANSIATTKGGRHVDYVADQLVTKLMDVVKKRNKGGVNMRPFQVKNHMWLFLNSLIENPTFDSQTKENMTLQFKSFGSKCQLSDKFIGQVQKCGIVESILTWVKYKQQNQLASKCHKTKHSKLKGIPKLEDANQAGTKNSNSCTLILTEGDSAKTLAVSGLGVVGRDQYGVFPLRGKMLNVREATHKQILENAEINNVIKIMGLQYKKKYESTEDLKSLRYGKLMIMTDQDQDGSHIKGLLINFIHHNWPSLIQLPFLEEFITPIVKVTKGREEKSFYSLPEFEEWKRGTDNWHTWKVKYYKGLGTSTAKEAKEYFSDMLRHRIKFNYAGPDDDSAIQLAFSKKMVEQRKEWLTNGMEERKQRKELGLPELYLYGKETKAVTYQEFVNKELILFSNMDNERSIPSLVDGMKPGQRKVLFTCFKRNDKREIKVAQLAGSVAEHSAYHHGEVSLMSTIIGLAQNFVGSNNINILQPIGQFGTRLQGGKDAASPRYIFTMLSPLARHLFNIHDEPLLNYLNEDNQRIEPDYYVPIIPMILVNGCDGIGTGWMTKIPNYNPREIVSNIRLLMAGEEPKPMVPWFKNFRGTVVHIDHQRFVINGEVGILDEKSFEITELPARVWTQNYKENTLEPMLHGSEKVVPIINDYKEYHTDSTVRFVINLPEDKLAKFEQEGLHKAFKLQTTLATTSMVLFDHNGCLRKYETVEDVLKEFYTLRHSLYVKRKAYMEGILKAETSKLSNQARFILEKIEGDIVVENKKKADIIQELVRKGFDSDPVKTWKEVQNKERALEEQIEEASDSENEESASKSGPDFNYLLGMSMWCLTKEKKDELLKQRDEKKHELTILQGRTAMDLWNEDLNKFIEELDKVEQKEREEEMSGIAQKAIKPGKITFGRQRPKKNVMEETKPSAYSRLVQPFIDPELRRKVEKASQATGASKRGPGAGRKKKETLDITETDSESKSRNESDSKSRSDLESKSRTDSDSKVEERKKVPNKTMKQTSVMSFMSSSKRDKKLNPKKNKKNPWSDSESEVLSDSGEELREVLSKLPRERQLRRSASEKAKYNFDSDMSASEEEKEEHFNDSSLTKDDISDAGSDGEFEEANSKSRKPPNSSTAPLKNQSSDHSDSEADTGEVDSHKEDAVVISDSDSSTSVTKMQPKKKNAVNTNTVKKVMDKNAKQKSAFDALIGEAGENDDDKNKSDGEIDNVESEEDNDKKKDESDLELLEDEEPKKVLPKKRGRKKASPVSEEVSEDEFAGKKKKSTAARKATGKRRKPTGSDSDDDQKKRTVTGKRKKRTNTGSSDDEDDSMLDSVVRSRSGRSRAPVKYNFGEDSDLDDY